MPSRVGEREAVSSRGGSKGSPPKNPVIGPGLSRAPAAWIREASTRLKPQNRLPSAPSGARVQPLHALTERITPWLSRATPGKHALPGSAWEGRGRGARGPRPRGTRQPGPAGRDQTARGIPMDTPATAGMPVPHPPPSASQSLPGGLGRPLALPSTQPGSHSGPSRAHGQILTQPTWAGSKTRRRRHRPSVPWLTPGRERQELRRPRRASPACPKTQTGERLSRSFQRRRPGTAFPRLSARAAPAPGDSLPRTEGDAPSCEAPAPDEALKD